MEKINGRKLKQEVQQALRDQVIRFRKQGKKNKDVAHVDLVAAATHED